MEMTLQDFISKYNGKGIDYDGHYGFQCVDLYRQYVQEVLNYPQSPGVSGAKDIWNTYLQEYFMRVTNTPEGVPEPGDIMIWGDSYGPYGHVAVVTKATLTTFTCFSQNDPVGSLCSEKLYRTYKPVLGWLHPKTPSTSYRGYDLTNIDSMKVCVDDHLKIVEGQLVDKSQYESIKGQLTKSEEQNEELSRQLGIKTAEAKANFDEVQKRDAVINTLNEAISKMNNTDNFAKAVTDEQEAHNITKSKLDALLWDMEDTLKLSHTSTDIGERIFVALATLGKLHQTITVYEEKVKSLEAEVKKRTTQSRHISKLTIKDCIIILIDKLKEKYGKK